MVNSNLEALEAIVNKGYIPKEGGLERTPWEELLDPVRKRIIGLADRLGASKLGYELVVHTGIWQGFLELAGQSEALDSDRKGSIGPDVKTMLSDAVNAARNSAHHYSYRSTFIGAEHGNMPSEDDLIQDSVDISKLIELGKHAAEFGETSHVTRILAAIRTYVFTLAEYSERRRQATNSTAVNGTKIASDHTDAMINLELGEGMKELATKAYRKLVSHYQALQAEDVQLSQIRNLPKDKKDRFYALGRMKAEIQDYYRQMLSCYTKARALVEDIKKQSSVKIETPELDTAYIERRMMTVIKQYQRITGDTVKYSNLLASLEADPKPDFSSRKHSLLAEARR